jgi:hypothetical protein
MNRMTFTLESTLPHPGPLPLGEGESSSDFCLGERRDSVHGSNAFEKIERELSMNSGTDFTRAS